MRKLLSILLILAVAVTFGWARGQGDAGAKAGTPIAVWTQEGESEGAFQFVKALADEFVAANKLPAFDVLNKETETLRQDFQTASLAGNAPDLLWTVNDHAGPFVVADLLQSVESIVDLSKYVPSIEMKGKVWGVPISSGNHLMLLYRKDKVKTPPKDTDELISMGKALTKDGTYAIVWNQVEPFWLVPWLGGFGGKVFAADGVTPTLNTPEMVKTVQFLYDLKAVHKIAPQEADYATADTLFKEGKAAMIINGDWSLGDYKKTVGEANLGVARLPMVKETGKYPAPYTSGKYFMVPKALAGDKLQVVKGFITFATSYDKQIAMVKELTRLPALKAALEDPIVKNDPILSGSAAQMAVGTPMPSVVEMRCNWDSMKPEMNAVLAGQKSAADAAAAMQTSATACIKSLQ